MDTESQPRLHVGSVFLILVGTVTVLRVEVGKDTLEEEEETARVRQLLFRVLTVYPFLLNQSADTSASVGFITKICRLQESLLTANQLPYLLKAIE